MTWRFDWKYLLGIVLTIASVVTPVYLWKSDLQAHDLSLRLISSSSLQPLASSEIYDVKMSVNGVQLVSPYFSTFELTNNGSKPILSSDFESPIEFFGSRDLTFVTARIDLSDPREIPAKISVDANRVSIAPFLSNPGDKVIFSVITSGAVPVINPKARIAGVKKLVIEEPSTDRGSTFRLGFQFLVSFIALTTYFSFSWILPRRKVILLDRRFVLVTAAICGCGGIISMVHFLDGLQEMYGSFAGYRNWFSLILGVIALVAGSIFGKYIRRVTDKNLSSLG